MAYSEAVMRLGEMADAAIAQGDGEAFASALKEFDRLLRLYPQFGDPLIDLTAAPGIIYNGIIRPLSIRYGVYEDRRLVLVVAMPVLLPVETHDAEGSERDGSMARLVVAALRSPRPAASLPTCRHDVRLVAARSPREP